MRRKLTKTEYILSALFAFIAAFPLATSSGGEWLNVEPLASLTQRQRLEIGQSQRVHERMIMQVREECEERLKKDEKTACPDVNDTRDVRLFLRGKAITPAVGTGSTEETLSGSLRMPRIRLLDLGNIQQSMLRRFQRSGHCPANLDIVQPGFQRLCAEEVRPAPRILRGILNIDSKNAR